MLGLRIELARPLSQCEAIAWVLRNGALADELRMFGGRSAGPPSVGVTSRQLTEGEKPTRQTTVGYGHYIHLRREFDRSAFAGAVEDIRSLIRRSEVEVVGPWGRPGTKPILEDDHISFNGVNYSCICSPEDPEYHCTSKLCAFECTVWRDGSGQAFTADIRSDASLSPFREGIYWFDCKTHRRPYDLVVMMAMISLKHHLGDSVVMRSKGRWRLEWGAYCRRPDGSRWPGRDRPNPIEIYEHVFPERAPVQNILSETRDDYSR